jgi:hypothetical protein
MLPLLGGPHGDSNEDTRAIGRLRRASALHLSETGAGLDEEGTESEIDGSVGWLPESIKSTELLPRSKVGEERQGQVGCYDRLRWMVSFEQLGVIHSLLGRAAGRVLVLARHLMVAARGASSAFSIAT